MQEKTSTCNISHSSMHFMCPSALECELKKEKAVSYVFLYSYVQLYLLLYNFAFSLLDSLSFYA